MSLNNLSTLQFNYNLNGLEDISTGEGNVLPVVGGSNINVVNDTTQYIVNLDDNITISTITAGTGTFNHINAPTGSINFLNTDQINFNTSYNGGFDQTGALYYDNSENTKTLHLILDNNVSYHLGEELLYRVKATSTITKGQCVMYDGTLGSSGILLSKPATGNILPDSILGIALETISTNAFGYISSFGFLRGIDTNSFNEGDLLYYDPTVVGGLTNVEPSAPNTKILMAAVVNKGNSSNGSIFIRLSIFPRLSDLSQVSITGASNNDLFFYDGTKWINKPRNDALNGISLTGGTIYSLTGTIGKFTTLEANNFNRLNGHTMLQGTGGITILSSNNDYLYFRPLGTNNTTFQSFIDTTGRLTTPALTTGDIQATSLNATSGITAGTFMSAPTVSGTIVNANTLSVVESANIPLLTCNTGTINHLRVGNITVSTGANIPFVTFTTATGSNLFLGTGTITNLTTTNQTTTNLNFTTATGTSIAVDGVYNRFNTNPNLYSINNNTTLSCANVANARINLRPRGYLDSTNEIYIDNNGTMVSGATIGLNFGGAIITNLTAVNNTLTNVNFTNATGDNLFLGTGTINNLRVNNLTATGATIPSLSFTTATGGTLFLTTGCTAVDVTVTNNLTTDTIRSRTGNVSYYTTGAGGDHIFYTRPSGTDLNRLQIDEDGEVYLLNTTYPLGWKVNTDSVCIGLNAGQNWNASSFGNVCIGENCGKDLRREYNVFVGAGCASSATGTCFYNVGVGVSSLSKCRNIENTAVGFFSLRNLTTGYNNTAIGKSSGDQLISGILNTSVGLDSMNLNTTASYNTCVGAGAYRVGNQDFGASFCGGLNSLGDNFGGYNVAIGTNSGRFGTKNFGTYLGHNSHFYGTGANYDIAVGYEAMSNYSNTYTPTTTSMNIAIGVNAMGGLNGSPTYNICVGQNSLLSLTSGVRNMGFGHFSGQSITSGSDNILIGYNSSPSAATDSNKLVIGNSSYGIHGINVYNSTFKGGINQINPLYEWDVNGDIRANNVVNIIPTTSTNQANWLRVSNHTSQSNGFCLFGMRRSNEASTGYSNYGFIQSSNNLAGIALFTNDSTVPSNNIARYLVDESGYHYFNVKSSNSSGNPRNTNFNVFNIYSKAYQRGVGESFSRTSGDGRFMPYSVGTFVNQAYTVAGGNVKANLTATSNNNHSAFDATNDNVLCDWKGYYQIHLNLNLSNISGANTAVFLKLYKNAAAVESFNKMMFNGATLDCVNMTTTIECAVGDALSMYIQPDTQTVSIANDSTFRIVYLG